MSIQNWFEEKQSAWLYRIVTRAEPDPIKSTLFAELADMAESQARIWQQQIERAGGQVPEFRPGPRARLVARLIGVLGPHALRPVLAAMKVRGMSVYRGAAAHGGHPMPTSVGEVGHRHQGVEAGGNLRAAVFGVNDGLVSNAALIMGVAGATQEPKVVLLTGMAGLLAGAFSMAAGEYVSMRSQRELFEYQIALEREELEEYPIEEQEELALIYKARGLSKQQADEVAAGLMKNSEQALDTLAREELGLNPDELGSPVKVALSSFTAFAIGAVVVVLPYLFFLGSQASSTAPLALAIALAVSAMLAVGGLVGRLSGRGVVFSALRQLMWGAGAAGVTFIVGSIIGVNIS